MLVPRKLGYPQTISTKIMFLSSISEICTSTTLIYSTIIKGGRRVFRQTEMARKMAGKTEINQKPTAAGKGN